MRAIAAMALSYILSVGLPVHGNPALRANVQQNLSHRIPILSDLEDFFRRVEHLIPLFDTDTETITLIHDGKKRTARVYIPESVKSKGVAAPLVISYHAWGFTARIQQALDLHDVSGKENGYMVVYPQGWSTAKLGSIPLSFIPGGHTFNAGGCCPRACSPIHAPVPDDVGFTRALVKHISEQMHRVDYTRVYATGMSNGGFMTHRLACEASDFLAAQAPVSGIISNKFWDDDAAIPKEWSTEKMTGSSRRRIIGIWPPIYECKPERAVPVMHFHGSLDPLVPRTGGWGIGGVGGFGFFNPVSSTISTWLEANKVDVTWENMPKSYSFLGTECWSAGVDERNVTYCQVNDMTHSWPGCGGFTPIISGSGIHATSASWDFFRRHRCPTCQP